MSDRLTESERANNRFSNMAPYRKTCEEIPRDRKASTEKQQTLHPGTNMKRRRQVGRDREGLEK